MEAEFSLPKVPLTALSTTLVRRGIIPALLEALGSPHILKLRAFAVNAYRDSLRVLLRLLYQRMGTPYLDSALDSGLLRVLVHFCPVEDLPTIRELFDTVLSGAVFYHHTAVELREGITAVEALVSTPQFLESETSDLEGIYPEGVAVSGAAGSTRRRHSAAAQHARQYITARLPAKKPTGKLVIVIRALRARRGSWAFPYHDRWFLRALLHHHYEERFGQILLAHARWKRLAFDFIVPAQPAFTVYSALDKKLPLRPRTTGTDAEWSGIVRRAEASGGRMMLHQLRLRHRGALRTLLIPLRLPSTTIGDGLKEMASRIIESPSVEDRDKVHEMVETALALRLPELWEERGNTLEALSAVLASKRFLTVVFSRCTISVTTFPSPATITFDDPRFQQNAMSAT
ncbi:hypothetical protein C8F01DRAFT_1242064 [Mycena amicta]|nr:hypothetical protein C8F01DRAFT_1242064 [Mycena amicta]